TDWNDYAAEYGLSAVTSRFSQHKELDQKLSEIKLMNDARPSQLEAIERVNALGGDLEQSQKLLTLSFESMKARGVESLSECWTRAADITVEKLESEQKTTLDAGEQFPDAERDQESVYIDEYDPRD